MHMIREGGREGGRERDVLVCRDAIYMCCTWALLVLNRFRNATNSFGKSDSGTCKQEAKSGFAVGFRASGLEFGVWTPRPLSQNLVQPCKRTRTLFSYAIMQFDHKTLGTSPTSSCSGLAATTDGAAPYFPCTSALAEAARAATPTRKCDFHAGL